MSAYMVVANDMHHGSSGVFAGGLGLDHNKPRWQLPCSNNQK